jgi:hypothetical protein
MTGRVAYTLDGDNMRKIWPFIGYSDDDRACSMSHVLAVATALYKYGDQADIIVSVVAPIAQSRMHFHTQFEGNITEIRFTAIKTKRPEEYYSTFYAGGPEPHIQGWDAFTELLKRIQKEWDVGGLRP